MVTFNFIYIYIVPLFLESGLCVAYTLITVILVTVCQVHGWRRTGVLGSSWKSGLTRPSPDQFLRRSKGGCESCQHSFHNNDITTLTSSFSCTPAGQRYMTVDEGRKNGC